MKTLKEFIQRLQDDTAFEDKARAFVSDDELMAFVRSEGYDFTLEELAAELQVAPRAAVVDPAPLTEKAAAGMKPEAGPSAGAPEALPKREDPDFAWDDPPPGLGKPRREISQADPRETASGELFRVGGGRHRGFSPRRLQAVPED